MKAWSLRGVLSVGVCVVLFGMALHAPFIVIAETLWPEASAVFKAWKELLIALLALLAGALLVRSGTMRSFLAAWPVRLGLAYIVLHLVLAVVMPTELLPEIAGLMIDLRFVAFFLLVYAAVRLHPDTLKWAIRSFAAGAAIVLAFGALQITLLPDDILAGIGYDRDTIRPFTTIDSNDDFIRINSTLRGPNPLGAMCVVYLALSAAYIVRRRQKIDNKSIVALMASVGSVAVLFASYSRSAKVAAAAAMATLGAMVLRGYVSIRWIAALCVVLVSLGVGAYQLRDTDWFQNVVLHEDPDSSVMTKSNDEHLASLADGTERAFAQPFGAGIGSTGSAVLYGEQSEGPTIENSYLFIAHESGWLGLVLFAALYALVLLRLYERRDSWVAAGLLASGVGLALIGILLPVWVDETVALSWWGLTGSILGNEYGKRTRQQKTTRTS